MPYGEGWLEKGIQFGDLFLNYIAFGKLFFTVLYGELNKNKTVPYGKPIIFDKTVPYGALNKNKTIPYGKSFTYDKTVPYGTLEENTNG